jgi:hypothetical protein
MPGFVLSQIALRLISTILGSCGVFCLIMSFVAPRLAADAFLLLGTATAIVYLSKG